jgi:hypothetical protein
VRAGVERGAADVMVKRKNAEGMMRDRDIIDSDVEASYSKQSMIEISLKRSYRDGRWHRHGRVIIHAS